MRADDVVKVKGFFLIVIIAAFATIDFGGEVIGAKPKPPKCPNTLPGNLEAPILTIEKTLISGETEVPINSLEYWELEIVVCYNHLDTLTDVIAWDTIPAEFDLINTTPSKGTVNIKTADGGGATKINWNISTMTQNEEANLSFWIATNLNPSGKQRFTSPREYKLNDGARVKGTMWQGTIEAGPTDPIKVTAVKP